MSPAALADHIGGIRVESVARTQSLDEITSKLGLAVFFLPRGLHLLQSLACPTNDEIVKSDALSATPQGIQRFPYGSCLSDRVTRMTGRHTSSVAPGAAPIGGECCTELSG
jgi:hypothetical protein